MTEKITAMQVRQTLGELLNRVALRHDQFVIERNGKPMAALVPIEKLEQLQKAARTLLGETMKNRRLAGKKAPLDETELEMIKHKTRKKSR